MFLSEASELILADKGRAVKNNGNAPPPRTSMAEKKNKVESRPRREQVTAGYSGSSKETAAHNLH